ncbi:Zinc finger CW-type PWWP domain protein 1 [Armadillidium vulgare]|nr:Zinc finger CW-type PWWP domain protein 1 [Armadillidium vulgare]
MNNELEFSLENLNDIKEEIETSLYCDTIDKELQKKDSLYPDLRDSFDTERIIPPYPSKTTFLTKEMLKENRLFSKASDIDSSKQGNKNYLKPNINSENLFRIASEINSNLSDNLGELQGSNSNDNKENEFTSQFSNNSEPIPYQGPGKGIFQTLGTNSSQLELGIKPALIPEAEFAMQSQSYDNQNDESLQSNTESCTNLFQTASNNLKSGKKFAPLFPLSVKQNLISDETSNSSYIAEKEKDNIENQVTADNSLSTKTQLKKPFKPVFKKPKKTIEKIANNSSGLSQSNSISKPLSTSVLKDCLPILKDKSKEVESKTEKQFSISQVEVKKEPDNSEVDNCFIAKEKVNFCVAKTTKKVVNHETDSNPIVKKSKSIEEVVPSKSQRNHIESFKRKFSFLYKSIIDNTDLINLPKTKSIGQKKLKKGGVNVSSKKVDKKDETEKKNSKTLSITVKSVENINSTPLKDHEIKYEEDITLRSRKDKSISDSQIIHCEESSSSTELSCLKENYDLASLMSDISETDPSSFLQDTNLEEHSSGAEDGNEGIEIASLIYVNKLKKEAPKGNLKTKEVKKKRLRVVGKEKNKKLRCTKNKGNIIINRNLSILETDNVEDAGKLEEIKKQLYDLQTMTNYPVWVCCDICNKWRCLRNTIDPTTVPKEWVCSMNEVVWVTNQGSDWWPAMVDDCPDNHVYYWLEISDEKPRQYHVTFFGSEATRAWVDIKFLRNFDERRRKTITNDQKLRKEHAVAMDQALQANSVDISTRRRKYCFASRRKGEWFLKNANRESSKRVK